MQLTMNVCVIVFLLYCTDTTTCFDLQNDKTVLANALNFIDGLLHQALELLARSGTGPVDCTDVQKAGNTKSGIYRIWPMNWGIYGSFQVYCDMETDGGPWMVIQRRGDFKQPEDYFYKTWKEYQMGFGKLNEDFWLGNDRIFALTNQGNYTLRIDMKDKEGEKRFAIYQEFWIENEKQLYALHVSGFMGDAGDSLYSANGMKFTTKDSDNDIWERNCAQSFKGGWWYDRCHYSNLNGLYLNGFHKSNADGIEWDSWKGYNYSLPQVEMKIRPV